MSDATGLMTRYLLGELSEREQAELELRYFEDPRVFDEIAQVESSLVDDYVRGRLSPEMRQRFESHFMADPLRLERVRFAAALAATVDRTDRETDLLTEAGAATAWQSWLAWVRTPGFALAFAAGLALIVAGGWFVIKTQRPGGETTADQKRPAPVPPAETTPPSSSAPQPVLAIATLALTVGPGERSPETNALPRLTIPPGTEQIRLVLSLREHDYARYRVLVRAIGGDEVLRQTDLVATGAPRPGFTITARADRFEARDYLLTLQGATTSGEYEDVSETVFRIER